MKYEVYIILYKIISIYIYKLELCVMMEKNTYSQEPVREDSSSTQLLINQGTFGCVYKPEFSCNKSINSKPFQKKMISKIITKTTNTQENDLGKIIQTIPQYDSYFAPILNSCPINLGEINNEELQKCQFIQNKKNNNGSDAPLYSSNTIRFVGKQSIYDALYRSSFPKILSCHIHLLKALTLLQTIDDPIIHYDLKENNIIFDEIYSVPIIIDFGISFQSSKLKIINKDVFYVHYDKYPPWCIEIVILSYIVHNTNLDTSITDQDISNLKTVCSNFVKQNTAFTGFETNELLEFENSLLLFIDSFVSKSWEDLIQPLIAKYLTWDNYSICVIFYDILIKNEQDEEEISMKPFILVYKTIIKNIILSPPSSPRLLPKETQDLFNNLGKFK